MPMCLHVLYFLPESLSRAQGFKNGVPISPGTCVIGFCDIIKVDLHSVHNKSAMPAR